MADPKAIFTDTLEYIRQLVQLGKEPAYALGNYRNIRVLESEIQDLPGIRFVSDYADDSPIWLEVERLHKTKAPEPDSKKLNSWLNQSHQPKDEPTLKEWIMISISNQEAKELIDKGIARRENVLESPRSAGISDVRLFAKDDDELNSEFADYLQEQWLPWAYREKPCRETMAIYEKFFTINQLIKMGDVEQPIELVWGIGHAVWKIPGQNKIISHPLIETMVEVDLDRHTQAIRICPRSVTQERPNIYTAPFEILELPGVKPLKVYFEDQLDRMEDEGKTIHPADPTSFESVLRSAVALLSTDALYIPDVLDDSTDRTVPTAEESLAITDTWAIYARDRGINYLIRDLERFQDKAREDETISDSVVINFAREPSDEKPDGFWNLIGRSPRLSSGALVGEMSEDRNGEENLYFPKPFNDAQRAVIERLDKSDGVVVQGPPGTGKTHTIANIICHYLATGRRVLVTAKSETALEVLKEQIPEEIQPLIISMVASDREGMEQQKGAIDTLQVKVVSLQGRENQIFREIESGEKEIFKLQQDIQIIDQQIKDFALKQLEPLKLDWLEVNFENAGELAKWVVENQECFEWFSDELGEGDKYIPLFGDEDIQNLIKAKREVGQDLHCLNYEIPIVNNLPSLGTIERIHHELKVAKDMEFTSMKQGTPRFRKESIEVIQIAEKIVDKMETISSWISKNETGWLKFVLHSRIYPDGPLPGWLELLNELQPELALIAKERKKYLRMPVGLVVNEANDRVFIKRAVQRGKEGKHPLTMFQKLSKLAQATIQSVTVLGKKPVSIEDWKHIEEYLFFEDKCEELRVRWNAIAAETTFLESIETEQDVPKCLETVSKHIEEAEQIAYMFSKDVWKGLEKIFSESSKFHGIAPKTDDLHAVTLAINQNLNVYRLSASKEKQKGFIDYIGKFNCPETKILLDVLENKVGSDKTDFEEIKRIWLRQISRLRHLHGLANAFETIYNVTEKIRASEAVNWATSIRQNVLSEQEEKQLRGWKEAWRWGCLNSILQTKGVHQQLSQLEESRLEKERRIKQLFEDVVKQRTYLMLCQSMTDKAKSALAKFKAAIGNVGSGFGIKAPIFMRAAQRAMLECADAIPCWIMPSWRVSEILPAEFNFFDLVIVDEASQCDIRELPVISRGKKLLIVGDDQQVSPTPPFIEFNKFVQLQHNYLSEQPFGDLMLPGYSLYDLASAVFPGSKIVLDEHFRCVEPIIRFSFQFYAGITIHPLRIPKTTERIDPPLVDIYVEGGIKKDNLNYQEADVIVDEIEELVTSEHFKERSIGVISLIGRKQAALIQTKLLERIGHEKYLKHEIICGDSATFQGREKDIVFLSMVASPGRSRALTMRQNKQRFNVAASRACDRLYLVRSVSLEDLPNPNDLKAKMIHHFNDPMPKRYEFDKELLDLCESNFEQDVFLEMTNRGYYVIPQVSAGDYRIDLVIEGDNDQRLAIELDGDKYHGPEKWLEDWTRQKVLERMGWRFWRCWASSYIKDPEECLNSLTQKLEEMGIKPLKEEAKQFAYTEHRTIKLYDDKLGGEASQDLRLEEAVDIGDKVVLNFDDHSMRAVTVMLTEDQTDSDNLIFSRDHETTLDLIGKEINDEVEVEIFGQKQKACIVQIIRETKNIA